MAVKLQVVHDPPLKNCGRCFEEFDFCQRVAPYGTKTKPLCQTHALAKRNDARRRNHRTTVERQYGLWSGGYDQLKAFQGGKCAICKRASGKSRNLAVDHDHKHCPDCSGKGSCGKGVRGLLCSPCNMMIGRVLRDNPELALAAYEYLTTPPFVRMQGRTYYLDKIWPATPEDDDE